MSEHQDPSDRPGDPTLPPLFVHLVFHPQSDNARSLATALHTALNSDPRLPGLRVPTVLLPEDSSGLPPAEYSLLEAERGVVVVLADDYMVLEQPVPLGRVAWPQFIADLAKDCTAHGYCFLPVRLSESAWPLHPDFELTNFMRAYAEPVSQRAASVERRMVIELCRYLSGRERGERAPVRIFLSHAKQDIEAPPKIFKALIAHLEATQPVEAWVDSGQIEPGGNFREKIMTAVEQSSMLVLGTANYSSRPYCRLEVLTAKKAARPMVVIEGLQGIDLRRFPYFGNVPVIAWGPDAPSDAVTLLLKEVVRTMHSRLVLARRKRASDAILASPPELLTVAPLPPRTSVLYPDPPLGDEELEALGSVHTFETPLQRAGAERTLAGKRIAVSISESDDIERYGLLKNHLDTALLEISRYLLVKGAALAYGGHLGSDGYTLALFDLVAAHQAKSVLPPVERIVNYLGWPVPFKTLPTEKLANMQRFAHYVRTPRPAGVEALEPATFVSEPGFFRPDSANRRYAWARGMTVMRDQQSAETDARIVIGGKVGPTITTLPTGEKSHSWYAGRIPGVVEEALSTLKARRPLYLCGAFGGGAALLIDVIEGKHRQEFTWDYQKQAPHAEAMRAEYIKQSLEWVDYPEMTQTLSTFGVDGLAKLNKLSVPENQELFRSRDMMRIVELLLTGLTRALGGTPAG
jgi:hypothetical protein